MADNRAPLDGPSTAGGGAPRGFRRREAAVAALLIAGVGLAIVAALLWPSGSHEPRTAAATTASLSQTQADQLAQQLSSPDPAVVAGVLAAAIRPTFQAAPTVLVPSGDVLRIDASTFTPGADADHGSVQATATRARARASSGLTADLWSSTLGVLAPLGEVHMPDGRAMPMSTCARADSVG